MLMSTKANRYAHALMKARAGGTLHPRLTGENKLTLDDAYDIARSLINIRIAQGETPVGRRIGFSNERVRGRYGKTEPISAPIWALLFDTSLEYAMDNHALHSLTKAQQPRVEPHLVFKLARTPAADATLLELADCLEWMAHGLEVVVSPYKGWEFDAPDAIAAFGLSRKLIVGEPRMLSRQGRHHLPEVLASATLSLSKMTASDSVLAGAGSGRDLMGSPLHALHAVHSQLHQRPDFSPLQAGEIVATGSMTDALPVKRGEVWTSAFAQLNLPGLSVSFS
jgi:2-keto-4-pentenoate hydratase